MLEMLGALPILLLAALLCLQGFLLACSLVVVQGAADAAARGASRAQVAAALPSAWRRGVQISAAGDRVIVSVRTPAVVPLPRGAALLQVEASSEVAA